MSSFFAKASALGVLLLAASATRLAFAEAPRVLLIRPAGAAQGVEIALVRVAGELTADGFEVVPSTAEPGASSASSMMQAETGAPATTVGLFVSADGTSADLWVVDKLTDKTVVRHLSSAKQSENASPEVLALRVVELLRASLLELMVERKDSAPRPKAPGVERAMQWAARPLSTALPRWAVEAGVAVLWAPGQVDRSFESVARARFAVTNQWHLRASFIGLGTRSEVSGVGGRAEVAQSAGIADLLFSPLAGVAFQPTCSLGLGAYHTSVSGTASWPYRGLQDSQWALLADAGLGLAWRFASRLELDMEGHWLWTTPEPIIRFASADGAHVAHPALLGSLTLTGWL